jgi:hypothetical protein
MVPPRHARHRQGRALVAAVQPVIPAVEAQPDVDALQAHVGVELGLEEDEDVEADVDEAGGPDPHVLPRAEVDADDPEEGGEEFDQADDPTPNRAPATSARNPHLDDMDGRPGVLDSTLFRRLATSLPGLIAGLLVAGGLATVGWFDYRATQREFLALVAPRRPRCARPWRPLPGRCTPPASKPSASSHNGS